MNNTVRNNSLAINTFMPGRPLRQDNVFPAVDMVDTKSMLNGSLDLKIRDGYEKAVIVDGTVQKFAAADYVLLRNEDFFGAIDERLQGAGIAYVKQMINPMNSKHNRAFIVDYILDDSSYHVNVKGTDKIVPVIRGINSYDGSLQTQGQFGIFREICSNHLHVAEMQLSFKMRKRASDKEKFMGVVIDNVEELIAQFMENEFYSLHKKFQVLSETPIVDMEKFVKYVLGKTRLFKYEKSEKNPEEASKKAQLIVDTINAEAGKLNTAPNLWLGYNAFNEYVNSTNKDFRLQGEADKHLFDMVLAAAN